MANERILTTLPDGGVTITCPSERAVSCLMRGATGPWHPWFGMPWWFGAVQFSRMISAGIMPTAAYRYVRTMFVGGVSRRDAIGIIAARDCGHMGTAIEIVDISEIPTDRTYRNAWRRSQNGGPIWIDDAAAIRIDEQRLWRAYART